MILRESIEASDIIKEIFYLSTRIFGMMPYKYKISPYGEFDLPFPTPLLF